MLGRERPFLLDLFLNPSSAGDSRVEAALESFRAFAYAAVSWSGSPARPLSEARFARSLLFDIKNLLFFDLG